jgi:hypothetical protein
MRGGAAGTRTRNQRIRKLHNLGMPVATGTVLCATVIDRLDGPAKTAGFGSIRGHSGWISGNRFERRVRRVTCG